jgi:hypothetical protein
VIVRCIGCAAVGAVRVIGGAENVRLPREPMLKPRPPRASASELTISIGPATIRATARSLINAPARFVNAIINLSGPERTMREPPLTTLVDNMGICAEMESPRAARALRLTVAARSLARSAMTYLSVMVSFTCATSCASVNGSGRKEKR